MEEPPTGYLQKEPSDMQNWSCEQAVADIRLSLTFE
jgi:hypothetical protein